MIDRLKDWIYGSEDFLKRILQMAEGEDDSVNRRRTRRNATITVDDVLASAAPPAGEISRRTFAGGILQQRSLNCPIGLD